MQSRAGYRVKQVDLPHLPAVAEPLRLPKQSGLGCSKMSRLLVQLGRESSRIARRTANSASHTASVWHGLTRPEGKEGLRTISQRKRRRGQDSRTPWILHDFSIFHCHIPFKFRSIQIHSDPFRLRTKLSLFIAKSRLRDKPNCEKKWLKSN